MLNAVILRTRHLTTVTNTAMQIWLSSPLITVNKQVGGVDLSFIKDFLKGVAFCILRFSVSEEDVAFFLTTNSDSRLKEDSWRSRAEVTLVKQDKKWKKYDRLKLFEHIQWHCRRKACIALQAA